MKFLPLICLVLGSCAAPLARTTTQVSSCCSDHSSASCSPTGTCTACKNCSSCKHCKAGGTCSVCR
ncbi:hypothetical protein OKA04_23505 [Luteolibacter flavescens]|uniref:Metallothionein n=1 Tax=Luteolibacter flavescens TaxID=1859460 RepID=A0ABT3FVX0_9BACT|nr:hypothetical protein [Luteolibacter flavescens]